MTAALLLVWRFENGSSVIHDFAAGDDMTSMCKEIAASMQVVDGGAAFWRGVAGDFQGEILKMQQERTEMASVIQRQKNIIDYARDRIGAFA